MKFCTISMIAVALAWTVPSVEAGVIYDNGAVVDLVSTSDSDAPPPDTPHFIADDFSLAAGANTITDIHWTGAYLTANTSGTDNFTIRIYADAGGAPSTAAFGLLHSISVGSTATRTDTGIDLSSFDLYSYAVDIDPVTLAAGTSYWLSIVNDTTLDMDDNWAWGLQQGAGNSVDRYSGGNTPWNATGDRADFQLTSVPAPASLALLGIGLAGLGWSRRSIVNAWPGAFRAARGQFPIQAAPNTQVRNRAHVR